MMDPQSQFAARRTLAVLLSLSLLIGLSGCADKARTEAVMQHGDIGTVSALRPDRGPAAISAARIGLDPANVPAALVGLVPLAEHWGINDDALRDALQETSSQAEKDALANAVNPHNRQITLWLDSLPPQQPMSDEAAAFMYMQLGLEEMGLLRMTVD